MGNIFNTRSEFDKREEQERIEELNVKYGNAPVAQGTENSAPVSGPIGFDPSVLTNQTTSDNKCPSCGATLAFDPATGGLVCNFCGSNVELKTMPVAPGLGYSLADLQNNAGRHLMQTTCKLLICGTCGGQFLADKSSLSGLCPYCGSNSITESGNTSGMLEPTGVIPFKISKDEAQKIFKQWISARRMAPTDLKKNSQITDLVGVYVPYWVFDCDTYTPYKGKFGKTYGSGDDQYTKYHKAEGVCKMPVKNLMLVASSRLEKDAYWKSVSKFDFNFIKKYDPNLLAGFWSESYTVDGTAAWQTAMGKIYDMIHKSIKNLEDADVVAKIEMKPEASNVRAKYVLAPIWITSFDYNGTVYRVLVNGQTGNIVGTWPRSLKRIFIIIGIVAGALIGTSFLRVLIMEIYQWIVSLGS
ncbi:MAG: TFIIB-type zinc ribbon-containing protein [Clostridiales bacterium]|nr:TFIIB-type zinc ribbon-containing protein [Clostridiales bacterium]